MLIAISTMKDENGLSSKQRQGRRVSSARGGLYPPYIWVPQPLCVISHPTLLKGDPGGLAWVVRGVGIAYPTAPAGVQYSPDHRQL
jgi:hypothetical protein